MMLKNIPLVTGLLVLFAGLLAGCDNNPTNAPSKVDVAAADAARAKAVDDNPKLTPEQKEAQKRMMGLLPGGRGPANKPDSKPGSGGQ